MTPKVSVIVTTHEKYTDYLLTRALPSVLKQTFRDIEVIIIQDGGASIASKVARCFRDSAVPYTYKVIHKFGSHPRPKNEGTKLAQADYVCYLDADNAYRPDHIQALWNEMQKNPVDMVYGDRMVIDLDGKQKPGVKSDFSIGLLGKQNYIDTSDGLIRKQAILDVGGWDEDLKFFADWNLWVRMAKNGSLFRRLPLVITDYYVHGDNNVMKAQTGYDDKWHYEHIQNVKLWPDATSIGPRPQLKVAVFTLVMDRLEYLIETLDSMREKTTYPFTHYILDQGVSPKLRQWLVDNEKKYGYKLELSDHNLGISKGSNVLLERIFEDMPDVDIIGKVDDDCLFLTDGWLEVMVDCYERSRGVILAPYPEGLVDHPGGWPRLKDGYINDHYVGITEHVGGLCVFAPAKVYRFFRWEEHDFLHGQQDWIFSQTMRQKGYVPIYLENVRVEHNSGTNGQKQKYPEYFERRKNEKVKRYEA